MTFTLEDREEDTTEVHIPAMGRHNVANALAAYAAATRLGLNAKRVIAGLSQFQQTGMRQKVVHSKGVDVIEDCYNANPDSMKAALAMFKEYPCKRRFALLGDMLELGEISPEAHETVGKQAAEYGVDFLVAYGPRGETHGPGCRGCRGGGPPCGYLPGGGRTAAGPDAARRRAAGQGQPGHGAGKSARNLLQ